MKVKLKVTCQRKHLFSFGCKPEPIKIFFFFGGGEGEREREKHKPVLMLCCCTGIFYVSGCTVQTKVFLLLSSALSLSQFQLYFFFLHPPWHSGAWCTLGVGHDCQSRIYHDEETLIKRGTL